MPESKTTSRTAPAAKARKRNPGLIWLLVAALMLISIWDLTIEAKGYTELLDYVDGVLGWIVLPLAFCVVGALILQRRPRQSIGWLLIIVVIGLTVPTSLDSFFLPPVLAASELTPGQLAYAFFSAFSWWILLAPIFLIFLLYPTGNFLTPRWRWVVYLIVFTILFDLIAFGLAPTLEVGIEATSIANPIALLTEEQAEIALPFFAAPLIASALLSVLSVFVRYRQAKNLEKAQLRWLFFACILFFIFFVTNLGIGFDDSALSNIAFGIGFIVIPVAIGIGILRYRLWDIDVVINRSLVYGVLTGVLAAIFAAVASIGGQALKTMTGEESGAAAAAVGALVVASLFQPLRAAIEKGINRRLFPENIDLAEGLGELNPELWPFLTTNEILNASLEHLQDIYKFDKAAAFVANGKAFKPAAAVGISTAKAKYALSSSEMTLFVQKKAVKTERASDFVLTVPIYWARRKAPKILGALRLGKRAEGRGYSSQEIRALESFGGKLGRPIYALGRKKK